MIYLKLLIFLSSLAAGKLVDVPDDTEKPTEKIICFAIPWYKVTVFFLVNYIAHVATIMPFPGQGKLLAFLDFLTAVFLPYSGLWRGASAIWRSSWFSWRCWSEWKDKNKNYNQLDEAARAGALAVIIRSELWFPQFEDQLVKVSATSLKPIFEEPATPRLGSTCEVPDADGIPTRRR
jgi:hypothetical protein